MDKSISQREEPVHFHKFEGAFSGGIYFRSFQDLFRIFERASMNKLNKLNKIKTSESEFKD
jgi:hypothetical protein